MRSLTSVGREIPGSGWSMMLTCLIAGVTAMARINDSFKKGGSLLIRFGSLEWISIC
jgi:hypothetical protein